MPKSGTLAGEKLPAGLKESDRLDPPIFCPATKAESGHDENITIGRMREILGAEVTAELERLTRLVYRAGPRRRRSSTASSSPTPSSSSAAPRTARSS